MTTIKFIYLFSGLLLLGACSHDSKRGNPLDPVLTPAVELQVALDDTSGTATLTWTPYSGEQPFAEYWVLRKESGLEKVDTLSVITDAAMTTFMDSNLGLETSYSYRVSVINVSGLEFESEAIAVRPLSPPAIEIRDLSFDSQTARGFPARRSLLSRSLSRRCHVELSALCH